MRISDWSSDVCSSDLERAAPRRNAGIGIDRIESTMPLGSVVDDGLQRLNVGDVHRSDIEAESAIGELVSARLEPGLIDIQYQYPRIIGCHHLRDAQPQSAGTAGNEIG